MFNGDESAPGSMFDLKPGSRTLLISINCTIWQKGNVCTQVKCYSGNSVTLETPSFLARCQLALFAISWSMRVKKWFVWIMKSQTWLRKNFPLLPMWVPVHTCLYMWLMRLLFCSNHSTVDATQKKNQRSNIATFQIQLKFLLLSRYSASNIEINQLRSPAGLYLPSYCSALRNLQHSETRASCRFARDPTSNCSQWKEQLWNAVHVGGQVVATLGLGAKETNDWRIEGQAPKLRKTLSFWVWIFLNRT